MDLFLSFNNNDLSETREARCPNISMQFEQIERGRSENYCDQRLARLIPLSICLSRFTEAFE